MRTKISCFVIIRVVSLEKMFEKVEAPAKAGPLTVKELRLWAKEQQVALVPKDVVRSDGDLALLGRAHNLQPPGPRQPVGVEPRAACTLRLAVHHVQVPGAVHQRPDLGGHDTIHQRQAVRCAQLQDHPVELGSAEPAALREPRAAVALEPAPRR